MRCAKLFIKITSPTFFTFNAQCKILRVGTRDVSAGGLITLYVNLAFPRGSPLMLTLLTFATM